jgi:hypothetical protein
MNKWAVSAWHAQPRTMMDIDGVQRRSGAIRRWGAAAVAGGGIELGVGVERAAATITHGNARSPVCMHWIVSSMLIMIRSES